VSHFLHFDILSYVVYAHAYVVVVDKSSAVADMLPECLYERIRQRLLYGCENDVSPTFDTSGSSLVREN